MGDANADGGVDFADLVALAQNYNLGLGATWANGDFTFDGAVDVADLVVLAQNYGSGAAVAPGASPEFNADWARAQSMVPKPSTPMIAMVATLLRTGRRRIRRTGCARAEVIIEV